MTILYAKFDLGFAEHPKIIGLSNEAFRAYVESVLYSRQHLTDGFIDARVVAAKRWLTAVDELTSNDPVNPSWKAVEGGYEIHGFAEKQTTSDDIEAMREQKRAAGKRSAEARKQQKINTISTELQQSVEHNVNTTSTEAQPETETETETYKSLSVTKGLTGMREDWQPTQKSFDWSVTAVPSVDVEYQTQRFVNYWLANGKRMKNWDATWRNWMLKQAKDIPPAQADRAKADEWMKAKTWRPES